VKKIGDRCALVLERLRSFLALQRQNGTLEAVLFRQLAISVCLTRGEQKQLDTLLLKIRLKASQVRRDEVAEPAARVPMNEQHAMAAEVLERYLFPVKIRQLERREWRSHRQANGPD